MENKKNHFFELIQAVEENNRINDGSWKDWDSAQHIEEFYGKLNEEYKECAVHFLNSLIKSNGENKQTFIDAFNCLEYEYDFIWIQFC
jgi:hypothetical protein